MAGGRDMNTQTTTLRLRAPLRAKIQQMAKRTRRSVSAVTQDLLEEALRMRECPLIYFADEPAGREAKVVGTGLGVWEIMRDYQAHSKNTRRLKKLLPDLSDAQIKAALFYYENEALYREGIQAQASRAVQRA
jgi:uncharacterized protein (DUF433 family)